MKPVVYFLDAISAYREFKKKLEIVKTETKEIFDELTLTEHFFIRIPYRFDDPELAKRQLVALLKVRKHLEPVTMPLTLSMVDFWAHCAFFGASLTPNGFDTEDVKDLLAGLEEGKLEAQRAIHAEMARLEAELSKLNGYDA